MEVKNDSKESACNAGDLGLIPRSGKSPEKENGYPLQYSCLENSMDRAAWRAIVHVVIKSRTQPSPNTFAFRLLSRPGPALSILGMFSRLLIATLQGRCMISLYRRRITHIRAQRKESLQGSQEADIPPPNSPLQMSKVPPFLGLFCYGLNCVPPILQDSDRCWWLLFHL